MTIDPVERLNLTMCAGALAASWVWASPAFAWSVALGAALETVNFRGLRRSSEAFFAGRLPGGWSAGFAVRFAGLTVGIGAAVWAGAHPVGLLIGLSMIVPAVVIEAWRRRPPVLADLPALPPDDPSWDRWDPWLARERDPDEDDA